MQVLKFTCLSDKWLQVAAKWLPEQVAASVQVTAKTTAEPVCVLQCFERLDRAGFDLVHVKTHGFYVASVLERGSGTE